MVDRDFQEPVSPPAVDPEMKNPFAPSPINEGQDEPVAPRADEQSQLSASDSKESFVADRESRSQSALPDMARGPQQVMSKTVSTGTTRIPSFEVDWDGPDDPENPRNWGLGKRMFALMTVSWGAWVVVVFSTTYTSGIEQMQEEFGIESEPVVTLGLTTYLLGLAVGTLFTAGLSEMYGRKPLYVVGMTVMLILMIPCALATSLAELVVVRFISAVFASAFITNSPGSVGDITTDKNRAFYFSIWSIGPINSAVFGPLIGGFTTEYLGWRWTNWLVMMLTGVSLAANVICPETYTPHLVATKAKKRRKETGDERWWSRYDNRTSVVALLRVNFSRPFVMAVTEPICIFWNLYVSTVYGILYLCFTAYPIVFEGIRGWNLGNTGLSFLGIGTGSMISIFAEPLFRRIINAHKKDPETGRPPLEAMVICVCIGAVLIPVGQFWFAWTCEPPTHWIWPILSGIPYGAGNTATFIYANNYIVSSYGIYAASASAGNTVMRSIVGAVLPLAGPALYTQLTPHWGATLLAFLLVALAPIPFVFYKYGGKIREKSTLISQMRADYLRLEGKRKAAAAAAEARDEEEAVTSSAENWTDGNSEEKNEKI